ncbi:hypothetical protein HaLaN_26158, partial [Haematococcus lacustris]
MTVACLMQACHALADSNAWATQVVRFVQLPQPNAVPGNVEWQMLAMPGYLLLATSGVVAEHLGLAEAAPGVLPCPTPVGHLAVSRQGNLFMRAKNRVSEHGPHHFSSRLAGDGDRSQ